MRQVVEVVEPQRERMDAILVFPSMPAVMRLNKLGTFNLAQLGMSQKKSPIGEFMKGMRKSNDRFEETMLKLVRTLPNVLKYLPSDKAQDAKNFIQVRAAGVDILTSITRVHKLATLPCPLKIEYAVRVLWSSLNSCRLVCKACC